MAPLLVKVDSVDATRDIRFDSFGPVPTDCEEDEIGRLYRGCRREYGRCISKVYISTQTEKAIPIGWVFQKRQEYRDTYKPYICETWVTVFTGLQEFRFRRLRRRKRHNKRI
jgi:hypothetical protein